MYVDLSVASLFACVDVNESSLLDPLHPRVNNIRGYLIRYSGGDIQYL